MEYLLMGGWLSLVGGYPLRSNFLFNVMQFSGESGQSNKLAPPLLGLAAWEILDPPLGMEYTVRACCADNIIVSMCHSQSLRGDSRKALTWSLEVSQFQNFLCSWMKHAKLMPATYLGFPRRGCQPHRSRCQHIIWQFCLLKTAYKWKKLYWGVCCL